jgi:ketoreductase RED2
MARFDDKIAIVTGSSSGIGEATARQLAAEGATVVVNSASSVEAGEAVAKSLPGAGYVRADITRADECAELIDTTIERHGRLDVLINNAGMTKVIAHRDFDAVTGDVFQGIMDVNLFGTWRMIQLAMPHLEATGDGAIVNISSVAGIRTSGSSIPYAVSKAALNHLTALVANVVGPKVRVNAVAPGLVLTPWSKDWTAAHDAMRHVATMGRSALPDDIAEVVLDVAAARYLTGQVVVVDGGLSLRGALEGSFPAST